MQGIIFNALEEFVLENADMEVWNEVIETSKVPNEGAYTAGVNYSDEEIVILASTLSEKLGVSLTDGLRLFGEFLFGFLLSRGPIELKDYKNTQSLLIDLEDVIHRGVNRIHPDAYTPFFEYIAKDANSGELIYRSKRKLCAVAEGLIKGTAKHFSQSLEMQHTKCVHRSDEECVWLLQFS